MRAALPLALVAIFAPPVAAAQVAAGATPPTTAVAVPPVEDATGPIASDASGLRMTVPVTIAGAGPFPFLIDTGAQRTVISQELARTLGLAPGRSVRVTAMAGIQPTATVVIPSIVVSPGAARGQAIEAPALTERNLGAAGLLGIDTLGDRKVTIDLDAHTIAVSPSRRRKHRVEDPAGEIVVRARSLLGQLVVTDAFVGTVRVRVVLDTGSVASVGNLALRARLGQPRGPVSTGVLTSVLGERLNVESTALDHVRFGELTIDQLPIAYGNAAPFRHLGLERKPAILLGMDTIALFRRVEIDFPNREVRLLLPRALAEQRRRARWRFTGD